MRSPDAKVEVTPKRILISAPGKVILFGEHAVVHQKMAVAASLGLGSYLYLEQHDDPTFCLSLPDVGVQCQWFADELPLTFISQESDGRHPSEIAKELKLEELITSKPVQQQTLGDAQKQAMYAFLYLLVILSPEKAPFCGFTLHVHSFLPVGAGLGSSASYSVVLATALLIHFGHIAADLASNPDTINVIDRFAFMAEQIIHGNPSGVDNAVASFGGAITFVKGEEFLKLDGFQSLKLLLTHTKVPRSTSVLVSGVRSRKERYPDVVNPILSAIDGVARQCREAFTELKSDRPRLMNVLEDLVEINHGLLCALGVSHPSLEKIIAISSSHGLKTKLTGAGGGGCAVTIIPDEKTTEEIAEVMKELGAEGFDCYETSVGGPGVRTVVIDDDSKDIEWMRCADRVTLESCFLL